MTNFNDPEICNALLGKIRSAAKNMDLLRIMEVCGTHTMAIGRSGIRKLLPDNIKLISGPGCPVCVTPAEMIDNAALLGLKKDIIIATYGDMIRVPGIRSSLENARSEGADIRIITSPIEILSYGKETLFLAVGFETTTAPIAAIVDSVVKQNRMDISFYNSLKTIPRALKIIERMEGMTINGFLLPGHVSAVIGADAYKSISLPSVISGFDTIDMLSAILNIITQIKLGQEKVVNEYTRVVMNNGNKKALRLVEKYFEPSDQVWRGLGVLPECSLSLREHYSAWDAEKKYGLAPLSDKMPDGCSCGEVLKGCITPDLCPLFGNSCTPDMPKGPCMVSSEGSCAAYFKYEREI